jgi:hypothetical protein
VILFGCAMPRPPLTPPSVAIPPAGVTTPPVATTPPPRTDASPHRAGDFFFMRDGKTAKLAYGPPRSDSVLLMLRCRRGAGRVQITDSAPASANGTVLILSSGAARSALPVRILPDDEHRGVLAVADAPYDLPALAAFRTSGRIGLDLGGYVVGLAAKPAQMKPIGRFFAVCAGEAR